jgi:hypothetical protein
MKIVFAPRRKTRAQRTISNLEDVEEKCRDAA